MALKDRIDSLKRKHAQVDLKLREEEQHRSGDAVALHRLKALKLGLKDEIERLMHEEQSAAVA